MGLILPNYLLKTKNFECKRCAFRFHKNTPSQVEKCPKCKSVVYDIKYKKGEPLDPYSRAKLRWYSDESGQYHIDEIKRREIRSSGPTKTVVVKDDKGRVIEEMPDFEVKGTNIGR